MRFDKAKFPYQYALGVVYAANERDFGVRAHSRSERRSPIPDAAAFELGEARHVRVTVARSARP